MVESSSAIRFGVVHGSSSVLAGAGGALPGSSHQNIASTANLVAANGHDIGSCDEDTPLPSSPGLSGPSPIRVTTGVMIGEAIAPDPISSPDHLLNTAF